MSISEVRQVVVLKIRFNLKDRCFLTDRDTEIVVDEKGVVITSAVRGVAVWLSGLAR